MVLIALWNQQHASIQYNDNNNNNNTVIMSTSKMEMEALELEFRSLGMSLLRRSLDGSKRIESRRFSEHFGTSPRVIAFIWRRICKVDRISFLQEQDDNPGQATAKKPAARKKVSILYALYHLKTYQTESVASCFLGCDEKTYRKHVRDMIAMIAFLEPFLVSFEIKNAFNKCLICTYLSSFHTQIKIKDRYKEDKGNDCLLSVDCVDFRICEPYPYDSAWSKKWSSHKFKMKPAVRYEIAICILTGEICWINGPWPCGQFNDWKIFNECGLRTFLEPDERVEADAGYSHGDPEVCKTPNGVFHPEKKKNIRNRVRARQETVNARLKNWKILCERYRHKLEHHSDIVRAIAVITQIEIKYFNRPLFSTAEYED